MEKSLANALDINPESLFTAFTEAATDYVIILDERMHVLYANPAILRLENLTLDAVVGHPLTAFFPNLKTSDRYEKYREVIRTGHPYFIDELVITDHQPRRHISLKAFRVGKGLALISTDITNRVETQRILEQERRIFHFIAAGFLGNMDLKALCRGILRELLVALEFDFGVIRQLNREGDALEAIAVVGLTEDQIVDIPDFQPLDPERYVAAWMMKTGNAVIAQDVTRHPVYSSHRKRLDRLNIKSIMSLPIRSRDEKISGIIHLAAHTHRTISVRDSNLFTTVAKMCAAVISRYQTNQALQNSERKHRELLDSFRTPVMALREDLTVLYCNKAYAGLWNSTPDQMVDRPLADTVGKDVESSVYKTYMEVMNTGENRQITRKIRDRMLLLDIQRIERGILLITEDITERIHAEEAVQREREYYRSFVESLSDWAWEMDMSGIHTYSNQAVEKILGYPVEEVVGYPLTKLWLNTGNEAEIRAHLQDLLKQRKGWNNFIGMFRHRDGSIVWTESTAIPLFDAEGTITGFRGIDRDITARKIAEDALRKSARNIEIVHAAGRTMAACLTRDEIFMETINTAEHLLNVAVSVIARHEDGKFTIKAVSTDSSTQHLNFELLHTELAKESLARNKTYYTSANKSRNNPDYIIEPFRSIFCAPMSEFGVFQALSFAPGAFTEDDARIINLLLDHSLDAIDRITLQENLRQQATHDPLTGVFNRNHLRDALKQEARRARRYKHLIAFIMVDIDRFKEINDRYGHQTGDSVLISVGEILRDSIRESDFLVRYGGDEFLIVLPDCEPESNSVRARILKNIERFNGENQILDFPLTLSLGCAYWDPAGPESLETIQNLADQRMYAEKSARYQDS